MASPTPSDEAHLETAMAEARAAAARGEVPVGAVLVSAAGEVLAKDGNRIIELRDPMAHAALLVLRASARALGNERLVGTSLYVTLEPCTMCAGAVSLARVARLIYAASDPKGGAVEHGARFFQQATCHHRPEILRLGDADAAGRLLVDFFRARRG